MAATDAVGAHPRPSVHPGRGDDHSFSAEKSHMLMASFLNCPDFCLRTFSDHRSMIASPFVWQNGKLMPPKANVNRWRIGVGYPSWDRSEVGFTKHIW